MPQCTMGKIHIGTPPPRVGQIDRQNIVKTLPSRTTCAGGNNQEWLRLSVVISSLYLRDIQNDMVFKELNSIRFLQYLL